MVAVKNSVCRKVCLVALTASIAWLFFLVPATLAETKSGHAPASPKSQAFAQISASALTLRSISSDFSQERHLSMLRAPLLSSGWFAYEKPDRLYWKFLKPSPAGFAVNGDRARRWSNDPQRSQYFEIEKDQIAKAVVEQVFAWARADFSWLEKRYRISVTENGPTLLKLVPLSPTEKKHLSHLSIAFSPDWVHVDSVEIHEKGGDYTRITFSNVSLNQPLPKNLFDQE